MREVFPILFECSSSQDAIIDSFLVCQNNNGVLCNGMPLLFVSFVWVAELAWEAFIRQPEFNLIVLDVDNLAGM